MECKNDIESNFEEFNDSKININQNIYYLQEPPVKHSVQTIYDIESNFEEFNNCKININQTIHYLHEQPVKHSEQMFYINIKTIFHTIFSYFESTNEKILFK
jgi:hypothetical protein